MSTSEIYELLSVEMEQIHKDILEVESLSGAERSLAETKKKWHIIGAANRMRKVVCDSLDSAILKTNLCDSLLQSAGR